MILLPADLATISSASRMGTPEESMVPSVRVKRATATLRTSGPNDRHLQHEGVPHLAARAGCRDHALKAMTSAIGIPKTRYQ